MTPALRGIFNEVRALTAHVKTAPEMRHNSDFHRHIESDLAYHLGREIIRGPAKLSLEKGSYEGYGVDYYDTRKAEVYAMSRDDLISLLSRAYQAGRDGR